MARSKSSSSGTVSHVFSPTISREMAITRLGRLLEQIPELRQKGRSSPFFSAWKQNVEIALHDYFGSGSLQLSQFREIEFSLSFSWEGTPDSAFQEAFLSGSEVARQFLESRIAELKEADRYLIAPAVDAGTLARAITRKVFVVHGHNHGSKETVARFLSQLELEPIILHEKADQGRTIIEKFEDHADVACAVVILSPDDTASSKSNPAVQEQRARQNVIFELGFFVGSLGRRNTFALVHPEVTRPSDIDGVLYIPMKDDSWKMLLLRELKAAGMDVDANKAF